MAVDAPQVRAVMGNSVATVVAGAATVINAKSRAIADQRCLRGSSSRKASINFSAA